METLLFLGERLGNIVALGIMFKLVLRSECELNNIYAESIDEFLMYLEQRNNDNG